MKHIAVTLTLVTILAMTCACSDSNPAATANESGNPAMQEGNPWTGTYFTVNEVGLGENGYVSLTNFTDQPASLAGLYLCQGAECIDLPDVVVGAGETARIAVGNGQGLENVVVRRAALGELRPADGEIALFQTADYDDPGAMTVYFQWGSTPHELTQLAIEAGLWLEGGYGPSSANASRVFKVPESGLWLFEEP